MASIVGSADAVPVGSVVAFQVEGESIAVANVDGTLFAFDDICTHRGCLLSEGMLQGTSVTCPCHFSVFGVTDGSVLDGPATKPLGTYAVEVVDGNIALTVGGSSPSETSQGTSSSSKTAETSREAQGATQAAASERVTEEPDHERIHSALSSVPLFADLDEASIERLEAFTFRKQFSPGEVIVEEGHTGNGLYVVLSGSVEVIKGLRGAHPQKVAVLQAGEPFGEMALLGDWKRSASVQAVGPVECIGLDRWAFLTHLKNEPNLAIRMLQMLANRLVETNNRLAE